MKSLTMVTFLIFAPNSPQRLVSSDRLEHPRFQNFEQYLFAINVDRSTSSKSKFEQLRKITTCIYRSQIIGPHQESRETQKWCTHTHPPTTPLFMTPSPLSARPSFPSPSRSIDCQRLSRSYRNCSRII